MKRLLALLLVLFSLTAWGQGVGQGFTPSIGTSFEEEDSLARAEIEQLAVSSRSYADTIRKRTRVAGSGLPNLAYRLGVDDFYRIQLYAFGDSKFNQKHTISRLMANFGEYFGFAGVGFMSLSTANNGRLGIIPRATGSSPVERETTPLAKYAFDGQAQELTGSGNVRLEVDDTYSIYTDNVTCTYYDFARLYYVRHPGGGQMNVYLDGELIETINANGSEAKMSYTLTGLKDTAHLLMVENVSGTNYTLDAFLMRSEASGVILNCVANSGFTAADFLDVWGTENKEILRDFPADMAMIRLGTNESNADVVPATFISQLKQMSDTIRQYSSNSDIVWIGKEGTALSVVYTDQEYNTAMRTGAAENGYGYFSLYDAVPDWSIFNIRGFSNDAVHENTIGSHYIGNFIFHSLMSSVPVPEDSGATTLQEVTDAGSATTNDISITGKFILNDGDNDIWIGTGAGDSKSTGANNVAIGKDAGKNTNSGATNVFIGLQGGFRNNTGEKNTAIGGQVFFNNKTGSENVAVGSATAQLIASGSNATTLDDCVLVGARARTLNDFAVNEIVLGHSAIGNGSNTATIGSDDVTATYLKGTVVLEGTQVTNGADASTPTGLTTQQQVDAKIANLIRSGSGSPEGSITAPPGTLYLNTGGGANTTLYVKESGTGNTGWVAK